MTDNIRYHLDGNRLSTPDFPSVTIEVDERLMYVGQLAATMKHYWTQVFMWAEANEDNVIERYLWFQFDGYLDNNKKTFFYPIIPFTVFNDEPYYHDAYLVRDRAKYIKKNPKSETALFLPNLDKHGLTWANRGFSQRYAAVTKDQRQQLMVIYHESPEAAVWPLDTNFELRRAENHLDVLAEGFRERAVQFFSIEAYTG